MVNKTKKLSSATNTEYCIWFVFKIICANNPLTCHLLFGTNKIYQHIISTEIGWWMLVQNKQLNHLLLSVLLAGSTLSNVTAPPKAVCWPSSLETLSWTIRVLSQGFSQAHNGLFVCILAARWDALYTMPIHWGLCEHPVLFAWATAKPAFPTSSAAVGWYTCVLGLP